VVVKLAADKIETSQMLSEIRMITEHFRVTTSNLQALYDYATEEVTKSWKEGDASRVYKALTDLIEGHGRDNEGSLQRLFDERDEVLKQLKVDDLPEGWLHIRRK